MERAAMRKHKVVHNAYEPEDVDEEIARLEADSARLADFAHAVVKEGHERNCYREMQRGAACACLVSKALSALNGESTP